MPVYNCDKYVREAVESILNQTYQDFEFIIVNDGSTDKTLLILNKYAKQDSRVRIINQSNSGIVKALNTGLSKAKGKWVFRMDGDDISLPHRFAVQVETIKKSPSLVLLGGWCQQINSEGKLMKINKYPSKHNKLVKRLEKGLSFFPHASACFRRDTIFKIGGYRERFRHAEDIDLWLRFSNFGEIGCYPNVIIKLRKDTSFMFNVVRLRSLIAYAARICHYRQKIGFSDLFQLEEESWQEFLRWIEKRMEETGYFQYTQRWQTLRNVWHANSRTNKKERIKRLIRDLILNPIAYKAFYGRFRLDDLPLRLAKESGGLF